MEWIAGFVIAVTVGLTGMGGGSFTVPVLVLMGLPTAEAVGTAMVFAAVLRLVIAPVYMMRRHVHARYLGLLLLGAMPGLVLGTWALYAINNSGWKPAVLLIVGLMLTLSSTLSFVPRLRNPEFAGKNPRWLALVALPIGVETGFSSAGAGALGTILLLNFSEMPVGQVVGTDILFGIVLACVGSVFHLGWGAINSSTLVHLLVGGLPGGLAGCVLAKRVPGAKLRTAVAFIAIALGVQLMWVAGRDLIAKHQQRSRSTDKSVLTATDAKDAKVTR
ncbi:MAG: permease [Candidatus Angelobacter sp. Gp1-AA117]|nr:MAG: permease [Candidatus Angelobacter sp. Gp1-AA117]